MRQACLLVTALLLAAAPARAQVTVDLQALDALPGAKPATGHSTTRTPAARPVHRRMATTKTNKLAHRQAPAQPTASPETAPGKPASTAAATPTPTAPGAATPTPPPATLPSSAPTVATLEPVQPSPAPEPVTPPPPPPVSDSATSGATATGSGLRVTFGTGQTDLSPASAEAIKNVVQSAPASDSTSFNVVAYAAGTPEDPSTARRLSLSRALAVRSALMADGVNSSRIYVRALGATGGDEAPDRVDLAVMGANATASGTGSKSQSP
jgi:outer membrane protein OmpA-like peptidoglycan-associated protein